MQTNNTKKQTYGTLQQTFNNKPYNSPEIVRQLGDIFANSNMIGFHYYKLNENVGYAGGPLKRSKGEEKSFVAVETQHENGEVSWAAICFEHATADVVYFNSLDKEFSGEITFIFDCLFEMKPNRVMTIKSDFDLVFENDSKNIKIVSFARFFNDQEHKLGTKQNESKAIVVNGKARVLALLRNPSFLWRNQPQKSVELPRIEFKTDNSWLLNAEVFSNFMMDLNEKVATVIVMELSSAVKPKEYILLFIAERKFFCFSPYGLDEALSTAIKSNLNLLAQMGIQYDLVFSQQINETGTTDESLAWVLAAVPQLLANFVGIFKLGSIFDAKFNIKNALKEQTALLEQATQSSVAPQSSAAFSEKQPPSKVARKLDFVTSPTKDYLPKQLKTVMTHYFLNAKEVLVLEPLVLHLQDKVDAERLAQKYFVLIKEGKEVTPVCIFPIQSYFTGNNFQWELLYLDFSRQRMLYFSPIGKQIPYYLSTLIKKLSFDLIALKSPSRSYQEDGNNSGAWVVEAALWLYANLNSKRYPEHVKRMGDRLVFKDEAFPLEKIDIKTVEKNHREILGQNKNTAKIDQSSFNQATQDLKGILKPTRPLPAVKSSTIKPLTKKSNSNNVNVANSAAVELQKVFAVSHVSSGNPAIPKTSEKQAETSDFIMDGQRL